MSNVTLLFPEHGARKAEVLNLNVDRKTIIARFTEAYLTTGHQSHLLFFVYIKQLLGSADDSKILKAHRVAYVHAIDRLKQLTNCLFAFSQSNPDFYCEVSVEEDESDDQTMAYLGATLYKKTAGDPQKVLYIEVGAYSPFIDPSFKTSTSVTTRTRPLISVTCAESQYQEQFTEIFQQLGSVFDQYDMEIKQHPNVAPVNSARHAYGFTAVAPKLIGQKDDDEQVYCEIGMVVVMFDGYLKHTVSLGEPNVDSDPCGHSENND